MATDGQALTVSTVESTELFVGTLEEPAQVVRVRLDGPPGRVAVAVTGAAVVPAEPVLAELPGGAATIEVPVRFAAGSEVDAVVPVTVRAETLGPSAVGGAAPGLAVEAELTVADPGWTVHLVSHFHYDPVWWNTQAAYTESWDALDWSGSPRAAFQHTGFALVKAHLELTRHDPDYRFVLAETDYLKPYWDMHPEDRDYLRRLLAEGRCELMGGTYNEPNTNLTGPESTI
ncbi:MAG: hypothetical protein V7637_5483, partial [Mycobacteriales bacterium]